MAPTARSVHTAWAATCITAFIGLVFRMLWSVAAGSSFLVFLVTPLPLLRKAAHFFGSSCVEDILLGRQQGSRGGLIRRHCDGSPCPLS
jgi:hypothetical protein